MPSVRVRALRWVADDVPGWIEVSLTDAYGHDWRFIDKEPVLNSEPTITNRSSFPVDFDLEVVEVSRGAQADGRRIVRVSVVPTWGIETVDGVTVFDLDESQLN